MSTIQATNLKNAASASNNIVLDASGNATFAGTAAMASSFLRNRIINGGMDIWQRGTGIPLNATVGRFLYTADRWRFFVGSSSGEGFVSRVEFPLGQTDVPGDPTFYGRFEHTAASTVASVISQPIENVRTFAGQPVTVTAWMRCASGTVAMTCSLVQFFGTGGSPSAEVTTSAGSGTITTAWQKFTFTVTLPSLSGKTLGTGGNDQLVLNFNLPTSTYDVHLAQVQLEVGTVATPFERRQFGQELALCQRYYEKSYNLNIAPGTISFDYGPVYVGTLPRQTYAYKVSKRAAPTTTLYRPDQTNVTGQTTGGIGITVTESGTEGFAANSSASPITGDFRFNWVASSEL